MKGLSPVSARLSFLAIFTAATNPSWADIDLVGDPTLFSTTDVTLPASAFLSSMSVSQHTLTAGSGIYLQGTGTITQGGQVITDSMQVERSNLQINGASILSSSNLTINTHYLAGEPDADASVSVSGAGSQINSDFLTLYSHAGNQAALNLSNGASATVNYEVNNEVGSVINLDNASLVANIFRNTGILVSHGDNTISAITIENRGNIEIDGTLGLEGDLLMLDGSAFVFTLSENTTTGSSMLRIDGYLFAENTINIDFSIIDPDILYDGFSIDLIWISSLLPDADTFDIDLSAFAFLNSQWTPTIGVFDNRLVLTITSAVPVPASLWLFSSALISLLEFRRNQRKKI